MVTPKGAGDGRPGHGAARPRHPVGARADGTLLNKFCARGVEVKRRARRRGECVRRRPYRMTTSCWHIKQ